MCPPPQGPSIAGGGKEQPQCHLCPCPRVLLKPRGYCLEKHPKLGGKTIPGLPGV